MVVVGLLVGRNVMRGISVGLGLNSDQKLVIPGGRSVGGHRVFNVAVGVGVLPLDGFLVVAVAAVVCTPGDVTCVVGLTFNVAVGLEGV